MRGLDVDAEHRVEVIIDGGRNDKPYMTLLPK
jgi:hypothetical protein